MARITSMLTFDGRISIGRTHGGDEENCVRIEITDHDAGCVAVTVNMPLKEFAAALFGMAFTPCLVEFNNSGVVGTVGENKEELVPVPPCEKWSKQKGWQEKALAPFEVDGWHARHGDIDNITHRHVRTKDGEFMRVVFFRNVPKNESIAEGRT